MLIVEDDHDTAEVLAEIVHAAGHDARVVEDGDSAIGLLEEEHVDLMLLDLRLPPRDGFEVARFARTRHGSRIRIVAITGFGGAEQIDEARAAGCDDVIIKPFAAKDLEQLLASIRVNPS